MDPPTNSLSLSLSLSLVPHPVVALSSPLAREQQTVVGRGQSFARDPHQCPVAGSPPAHRGLYMQWSSGDEEEEEEEAHIGKVRSRPASSWSSSSGHGARACHLRRADAGRKRQTAFESCQVLPF